MFANVIFKRLFSHLSCSPSPSSLLLNRSCSSMITWNYDSQDKWVDPSTSKRQSPINIGSNVEKPQQYFPIIFNGNYTSLSGQWTNTSRSLQFNPTLDTSYTITTLKGEYDFKQFHFHWGHSPGQGSEHLVNARPQDAELHFVHSKRGGEGTVNDGDYLTVLGVLLRRDPTLNVEGTIWEQLKQVPSIDKPIILDSVNITELLPVNRSYWYYEGSLTTPPCSEIVQWYVFKHVVSVPESVIRTWSSSSSLSLPCNFRHIQDVNERKVWLYEESEQ